MAKTKVVVHEDGLRELLRVNKPIRDQMFQVANAVARVAQSTADSAQKGAGGRIAGYAEAGFSVTWEDNGKKRPHVNVTSNADPLTALKVLFYTQKRDGVAHLRAALYSQTRRG